MGTVLVQSLDRLFQKLGGRHRRPMFTEDLFRSWDILEREEDITATSTRGP